VKSLAQSDDSRYEMTPAAATAGVECFVLSASTLQRLCPIPEGVNAYLADPAIILSAERLECGFCATPHQLWRHGYYHRYLLLPAPDESVRIPVIRLFCSTSKRTVSLLPDPCIPKRQHGVEVLLHFLVAFLIHGLALLPALEKVRPDLPGHSGAQSLLRGFEARADRLRDYLAAIRPRMPSPMHVPRPRYRELTDLLRALLEREQDPVASFRFHARAFHARFGKGIA
jgi:hypothetical protein